MAGPSILNRSRFSSLPTTFLTMSLSLAALQLCCSRVVEYVLGELLHAVSQDASEASGSEIATSTPDGFQS